MSDNEIMLRVKAGDLKKMALLFTRYQDALYGFLFHLSRDAAASEDMVQNVFFRMLKYRHTFTGSGELRTWMYHIARNVLKDHHHAAGREPIEPNREYPPNAHEKLEQQEAETKLYAALQKLNMEHKEVITLNRLQELPQPEVARLLNISQGAVRTRVYRAIQELKKIYHEM